MRDRLVAALLCLASAGVLVLAARSTSWWRFDKRRIEIGFGLARAEACQDGECHGWKFEQFTRGEHKGIPLRFTLTRIGLFVVAGLLVVIAGLIVVAAAAARTHLGRSLIGLSLATGVLAYFSIRLYEADWMAPAGNMGWAFPGVVVALAVGLAGNFLGGRQLAQRSVERALDL
jgi:hypothetical protein